MFKLLRNHKGQGITVQYTLTFFLVIAVIGAMTVYVRRAIQGRVRDARTYMVMTVNSVFHDPSVNALGNLYWEYEPYYANADVTRGTDSIERLSTPQPGGVTWIDYDSSVTTNASSTQAPPRDADQEYNP